MSVAVRTALLLALLSPCVAAAHTPQEEAAALAAERASLAAAPPGRPAKGELSAAEKIARIDQTLSAPRRPAQPGRYIEVNVAEGAVRGYEDGKMAFESRAIAGKPTTRTPLFSAKAVSVTFNPTWTLPPSLKDYDGQHVRPGPSNPLGHIRVDMPNGNAVYLHSTNQAYLFDRKGHAYSHGCVRVKDAVGLGRWLLGDAAWAAVDGDALAASWREKTVRLPEAVPVYIEYRTAALGDDGKIAYFADPYEMAAR
jgi:murein L,D-transpeptidase YcbB/YkuD